MLDWIDTHKIVLAWLSGTSALMFVGSLIAIPWLVIQIPANYFDHRRHILVDRWAFRHPVVRVSALVFKNAIGVMLLLAGIVMLLLPGQGILTVLIGLLLIDFPGKFALERWLARKKSVLRTINWIRRKANHPPLKPPHPQGRPRNHRH